MAAQELFSTSFYTDPNLVNYYRLENLNDSKGTSTLTNTGGAAFNPAKFNNGVDFGTSNTTKYLDNTGAPSIDGGSCSISLWVKLQTEIGAGAYILACVANNNSKTDFRIEYDYNGGTRRLLFGRNRYFVGIQGPTYNMILGTASAYQVGLAYDGTNISGFVGGSLVAGPTAASGNGISTDIQGIFIGAQGGNGNNSSVIIDDMSIFSRALGTAEMYTIANGLPNQTTGASFLFNFV